MVIGLVGEKGGGKGTFAEIIKQIARGGVSHLRFSDILLDIAKLLDIPKEKITRGQLQELAQELDRIFGKGTLTKGMQKRIQENKGGLVIVDGIRWATDLEMIGNLPNSILVYVTANPELRWERVRKRKEKAGEGELTFERFMAEEQAENEKYIPEIGKVADVCIENNGTSEEFRQKVEEFYIFKTR
jgi:dephospho-CoA kinase